MIIFGELFHSVEDVGADRDRTGDRKVTERSLDPELPLKCSARIRLEFYSRVRSLDTNSCQLRETRPKCFHLLLLHNFVGRRCDINLLH